MPLAEAHPGFNPLPSPKQGETPPCGQYGTRVSDRVSIRSPHRSKGRQARRPLVVSIRSPHRSKGRPCGRGRFNPLPSPKQGETTGTALSLFQSAPLTEARGAQVRASLSFNPLPSPKQGETDCRDLVAFERGHGRFNPLPSPKQGETLVAITSGITKTYTGKCAIRSNSCQECPTRLPRNAITCCYAGSFQLRESKCKTPSLHFRARYKTSGSFKSTGSPTP